MDFLEQIIRLISEPPGSIIYHLVTLFSLQVVFALSYSRWRRNGNDYQAQRFMWASGAIFLGRVLLLLVALLYNSEPYSAAQALPPLEQAVNTATIALLVWALVPRPKRWQRMLDILLVVILVVIGILYLFFAQEWGNLIQEGITYYSSTPQAAAWAILQLLILITGLGYLLVNWQRSESLPAIILAVLLIAELIHLWNNSEIIPTETNVPYWIRLGYLVALPLWAVYAYQHVLSPLLISESEHKATVRKLGKALQSAAEVIATQQRDRRVSMSLRMVSELLNAAFTSIGFIDRRDPHRMNFQSDLPTGDTLDIKQWAIDLTRHPALNAAFIQSNTVELLPLGLGARQLHEFYGAFGSDPMGPLLIQPLEDNGKNIGLLVIAANGTQEQWSEDQKLLLPGLASYICQAVVNSQLPAAPPTAVPLSPQLPNVTETVPSAIILDQIRLSSLEAERDELKSALQESIERRKQAEEEALIIKKQAAYLAAALKAAQESQQNLVDDQVQLDTTITQTLDTPSQPKESTRS